MQILKVSVLVVNNLRKTFYCGSRLMSSSECAKSLLYKEYGEPADVLQITTESLTAPQENEVVVKWLYAPVNPADINTIQGKYPSKPPLPAVPGNEGVGEIVAVGTNTNNFCVGDKVVPNGVNKGTWRTHALYKSQDMYKINNNLETITASMLNVNPCTAYRMLKDFVPLKPGDTVIQNGGNSAVGLFVIQLCRIWGLKSVNIIRNRPDVQELKNQLLDLGANVVMTEEELRTTTLFKSKTLPKPQLALNCVCGKNASEVQRHLDHGGIMVTYGAMSREPLTVPASSLIFKNLSFKGFWMTTWTNKNANSEERHKMLEELQQLFINKELKAPPHQLVSFCNYKEAVVNALKPGGQSNAKYILDLTG
ncbi:enoyl-[acyl-carrier-protein] reductase, mitochondrial-like [Copidosoma floridanum]|uniref:enoyl-[acyl-carrier-protein] reductase, mitochondrial-like n=1 Tax=Copidosoma floridanum TaxID=29053 RepID=UPI0006C98C35|nr:enoyl-[acyl-carrier-protein] reductase, mitochondrial-like [Copidosoma floridanum]